MRKKKIFIGTLGMDQHELGAIAVARLLRDAGMEVLYMGRFNLPPAIVQVCLECLIPGSFPNFISVYNTGD